MKYFMFYNVLEALFILNFSTIIGKSVVFSNK